MKEVFNSIYKELNVLSEHSIKTHLAYKGKYDKSCKAEQDLLENVFCIIKQIENNIDSNYGWIPVEQGFPASHVPVQITYMCHWNRTPVCDVFAYRHNGKWLNFYNDEEIMEEVLAWKEKGPAYTPCFKEGDCYANEQENKTKN